MSDIALELVDGLKVLDPDGRLEKQTLEARAGRLHDNRIGACLLVARACARFRA